MSSDMPQFKADITRRLHCAEGHLHSITAMVERGDDCESLVRQLLAVQGALREVNRLVLNHHLAVCVREQLQGSDTLFREKYLSEIVTLYQLLGVSAPSHQKERV